MRDEIGRQRNGLDYLFEIPRRSGIDVDDSDALLARL